MEVGPASEYSESSYPASGFARHCTPPRRPGPKPATPGPAGRCLELATNGIKIKKKKALTERRCAQESAVDATVSVLSGTDRAEMCCKQSKSANEHQKVRTSTKNQVRTSTQKLTSSQGERPVVSASAQHRVKQSGRLALRARGEWCCQCHGVCPLRHAPSGDMTIHDLMLN